MSALPSRVQEEINADPRNEKTAHIEDIHVEFDGAHFYFSVEVEHRLDAGGYRRIGQIKYQGRKVDFPEPFREFFEQILGHA